MADKTKAAPDPPPSLFDRHLALAPGPGKYEVTSAFSATAKGANRWSFAGRPRAKRDDVTPGPDKYAGPVSSFGGTKWTMAARLNMRDKEDAGFTPTDGKAVIPPTVRSYIGTGPKFSLSGRTRMARTDATPDPTKYNPLQSMTFTSVRPPSFSMGAKFRSIARDPYASDNAPTDGKAVIPPQVKSLIGTGPKYSMSARLRVPRGSEVPGPGNYPGANIDIVGHSGPRFSISARVKRGIAYGYFGDEPRLSDLPSNHQPDMTVHKSI